MSTVIASEPNVYRLEISSDGLVASLHLEPAADFRAAVIIEQLHKLKFTHLQITGSLGDHWRIRSAGDFTLTGAMGASMINARGRVDIQGGIAGADKGKCITEQSLIADHLSHACVVAGGDVTVRGEILSSRVMCGGKLTAGAGSIVGGKICANTGVVCRSIGNAQSMPTVVEAGTNQMLPLISAMARVEIDADSKRLKELRDRVEPLLKNARGLAAKQREQVTELQYEACELESAIQEKSAALEQRIQKLRDSAYGEIQITDTIYAGVVLRLARHEVVIRQPLAGPLKIRVHNPEGFSELMLFQESAGGAQLMESRRLNESPAPSATAA